MQKKQAWSPFFSKRALGKALLLMKLIILLTVAFTLQVSARVHSQNTVSLHLRKASLKKIFFEIEKKTQYRFFFNDDAIPSTKVDIDANDNKVTDVLDGLLLNTSLTYKVLENNVIIILQKTSSEKQQEKIRGRVVNNKGESLAGVTVMQKGTQNGTVTNSNGVFILNVADTANLVLEFSIIGYETQAIRFTGQSDLAVRLNESQNSLNDVVVIGYGSQRKENLTGAVGNISSKELDSRPLVNLGQGLQGLIPNLNISLNNGKPGTKANYNIRGITGIGDNGAELANPLIMVDGVQMDPDLINPADVESVTVLKDAASAAIYGSRGAFGVILITTKSAKKNAPLRVNYSGSYTLTRPTRLPKYLNSVDYIAMHREADRNGQLSGGNTASFPFTTEDSIMAAKYFADPQHNPSGYPDPGNPSKYRYVGNTDWVNVLYPDWAPQTQHNLSVSGGSEKTSFIGSIGFFDQKGILKYSNEDYQRINPGLKLSTDATSWLTLNFKANLNHIYSNAPNAPTNGNHDSYIQGDSRPNMPVYNPNGVDFAGQGSWTNPVAVMVQNGRDKLTANDLWFTGGVVLTPINKIKINADYTYNNYSGFEQKVQKQFSEYGVDHVFLNYYPWTYPDATTEINTNNNYNVLNVYANYENTFKNQHYFKATIGYNQEYRHFKGLNTRAKNLIDPGTPFIGLNADDKPGVTGYDYEWALNGLLYRLNYIFNSKYLFEIDGRYDGTSAFASGKRFVWSPSASAGWRVSEENFFHSLKNSLNDLKIRLSYGQLPNQLFNPNSPSDANIYPYIALLPTDLSNYIFGSQQSIYVGAPGLVSTDFTWEKVVTKDIGLDFALLHQRLSGSFDWYIRDTKDMLVSGQPLPGVLGTDAPKKNAANLRTRGWEFSLNWHDKIGKDFDYSFRLGLSDYTAWITKYDLNPNQSLGNYYVGQKLGEIWGFVTDGYFKSDAEAAVYDQSQLTGATLLAGDIKYRDLNGDKKISYGDNTVSNPGDRRIIGNSTPRYQYGFNIYTRYKNFDLSVFLQGVAKRDIMPGDNAFFGFYSEWSVPFEYMKDHWEPNNTNAYFPRLRFGGGSNFQTQTKYLQNAAYCRLKNISFGYTLPQGIASRAKLKNLRLYVTGQNLFEITKLFKAYDPEIIGFGTYPLSRAVSFGLQLGL